MRVYAASRRFVLGGGLALLAAPMAAARDGRLAFEVLRNGRTIGRHSVSLSGAPGDETATIEAAFEVRLGPVPVFRYSHEGTEVWRNGRFASLETRSVTNGRHEQVSARRAPEGVLINAGGGHALQAPADAAPLTHWNMAAFRGPVFNPQTGKLARETITRTDGETLKLASGASVPTTRMAMTGDAAITDWYDAQGAWLALRGKGPDGSTIEYRRI